MPVRLFVGNLPYALRNPICVRKLSRCATDPSRSPLTVKPDGREGSRSSSAEAAAAQSHQAISRSAVPGPAVVGQRSAGARTRRAATGRVRTASAGGGFGGPRPGAAGSAATPWRLRSEARSLRPAGAPGGGRRRIRPRRQAQKAIPEREAKVRSASAAAAATTASDLVDDGQDAATADFDDFATSRKSRRTTNNPQLLPSP